MNYQISEMFEGLFQSDPTPNYSNPQVLLYIKYTQGNPPLTVLEKCIFEAVSWRGGGSGGCGRDF
jgi:hypothetical protein